MESRSLQHVIETIGKTVRETAGLDVLMVFGSRARGDATDRSDWDFGYLATDAIDVPELLASIVTLLGTDRIDLVDLQRASGLLRYRAARDGRVVFEARPGTFERFRFDAVRFWCDARAVLQRGYEDVLAGLTR